jgi:hypothetical protein
VYDLVDRAPCHAGEGEEGADDYLLIRLLDETVGEKVTGEGGEAVAEIGG